MSGVDRQLPAALALAATYGTLDAAEASSTQPELLVDLWSYFAVQGLEWLIFSRVLLVGLLEERNYVLGELPCPLRQTP